MRTLAAVVLCSLVAAAGSAQQIQRLTSFNTDPVDASSYPVGFFTVPARMYFSAYDGSPSPSGAPDGAALYALDAGQRQAIELPSPGGDLVAATAAIAYLLVFDSYDPQQDTTTLTLWRSDGTTSGTHAVAIDGKRADFYDDPYSCASISTASFGAATLLTDGCTFVVVDPVGDRVTPVVDPAGQRVFVDSLARLGPIVLAFDHYVAQKLYALSPPSSVAHEILGGVTGSSSAGGEDGSSFAAGARRAFFYVETPDHPAALWTTAGTAASTRHVADVPDSFPGGLTVLGDEAYFFVTRDGSQELWQSDATAAGTHAVARLDPAVSWFGGPLAGLGPLALFFAEDSQGDLGLWAAGGTEAGPRRLAKVCAYPCVSGYGSPFDALGEVGGRVLFYVGDELHGVSLWSTDGTASGTVPVRRLCRQGCPDPGPLLPSGGLLYFGAADDLGVEQLWRSDGTRQGTFPLTRFKVGQGFASYFSLGLLAGSIFFEACDDRHGCELWRSDGSPGAAVLAQDLNTTAVEPGGAMPALFAQLSSGVVFSACDHDARSLWFIRRGKDQPRQLAELPQACRQAGADDSFAVAGAGELALFAVDGKAVWRTDGSPQGTFLLTSFTSGFAAVSMTRVGSEVWFLACLDSSVELWRSDGSPAGTERFASLPNPAACPGELAAVGQRLFFQLGSDLWTSDGTRQGTLRLASPAPCDGCSDQVFHRFLQFGDRLLFSSDDDRDTCCSATWRSDGTPAGTFKIEDLGFIAAAAAGGQCYLLAPDGLRRTNGEPGAASKLVDFASFPVPAYAGFLGCSRLAFFQGQVYFSLSPLYPPPYPPPPALCSLLRSDGTQGGTRTLGAVDLGSDLFALGDRLFFVGTDPSSGLTSLWQTTGARQGTRPADMRGVLPSSGYQPVILGTSGDGIFFTADDGSTGRQLYLLHF